MGVWSWQLVYVLKISILYKVLLLLPIFPWDDFWGLIQLQFFLGGMGGSTTN